MKHNVLKRLQSVMLCLVMVVSLLPVSVFAEGVEDEADTEYVDVVVIYVNNSEEIKARDVIKCKVGDTVTVGEGGTIVPPEISGYLYWMSVPESIQINKPGYYEIRLSYGYSAPYTVNHYIEPLNGGDYELIYTEKYLGLAWFYTDAKDQNYPGFSAQMDYEQKMIAIDGSTVVDIYYTRNSYTLTYMLDGEEYVVEKYKYEEAINAAAAPAAPVGHVFSGWIDLPETMPAGNVTVTGSFSPRTDLSYTVNYLDENGNEVAAAKTVTGQTFGAEITESAIAVEGYTVDETSKTITIGLEGNEINFYYTAIPVAPAEPAAPEAPAAPAVPAPAPVIAAPVIPAAPVVDLAAIPAAPVTIDDEATPLAGGTAVTVDDPMNIEDEDTPLAGLHECCILHFIVICIALVIMMIYMNDMKKRQQEIFKVRQDLDA